MLAGMNGSLQFPPARTRRAHRAEKAFTILEVMTAASILVLTLTSSLIVLQRGFQAIDSARYTTLAGQILQSQMEKIRLLNWSQLTDPVNGPAASPTFTPDVATSSAQLSHFSCTQSITDAPSPFTGTMKDITLTATWTGTDGRRKSLSYTTRYGQNGISDFFYTTH